MTQIEFDSLDAATAYEALIDKAFGYPTEDGTTASWDVPQKHPSLDRWCILADERTDDLVAGELAPLSQEEKAQLIDGYRPVERASDWDPPPRH